MQTKPEYPRKDLESVTCVDTEGFVYLWEHEYGFPLYEENDSHFVDKGCLLNLLDTMDGVRWQLSYHALHNLAPLETPYTTQQPGIKMPDDTIIGGIDSDQPLLWK